jgi:hypothetical protein
LLDCASATFEANPTLILPDAPTAPVKYTGLPFAKVAPVSFFPV